MALRGGNTGAQADNEPIHLRREVSFFELDDLPSRCGDRQPFWHSYALVVLVLSETVLVLVIESSKP